MMNCLTMSYLTFSPTTFSSPIRTHTWVNFMLQIEEHRGVRMRAPGKCRQKKILWHQNLHIRLHWTTTKVHIH